MKDNLSRSEVEEILQVTKGRVRFYIDKGIISDIEKCKGKGFSRKYSMRDLFILAIIVELSSIGLPLKTSTAFIEYLCEFEENAVTLNNYSNDRFNPKAIITKDRFEVYYDRLTVDLDNEKSVFFVVNFVSIYNKITKRNF